MHDTPSSSSVKQPGSALDPLWFKDAIIYELHVKAFEDANNDGIGDFQGLLSKLDYLQELGITCIWLLPFFASPLRDDGYDIADYMTVHPSYGTLEDFQTVLHAAHDRGLQVMIELVVNHTSDQHAWFQRARLAPPGSPERDYYVWSDTDEKYKDARIIFTDTEKSNWTWDPIAKAYYWHRFLFASAGFELRQPAGAGMKCCASCASGSIWAWMRCALMPFPTWSSATAPTAKIFLKPTPS